MLLLVAHDGEVEKKGREGRKRGTAAVTSWEEKNHNQIYAPILHKLVFIHEYLLENGEKLQFYLIL